MQNKKSTYENDVTFILAGYIGLEPYLKQATQRDSTVFFHKLIDLRTPKLSYSKLSFSRSLSNNSLTSVSNKLSQ